jgi:hypothetical protein
LKKGKTVLKDRIEASSKLYIAGKLCKVLGWVQTNIAWISTNIE